MTPRLEAAVSACVPFYFHPSRFCNSATNQTNRWPLARVPDISPPPSFGGPPPPPSSFLPSPLSGQPHSLPPSKFHCNNLEIENWLQTNTFPPGFVLFCLAWPNITRCWANYPTWITGDTSMQMHTSCDWYLLIILLWFFFFFFKLWKKPSFF